MSERGCFRVLGFLFAVLASTPSTAQAGLPLLPERESFVYARTTGDRQDRVEIELTLKTEKGVTWYDYHSKSGDEEAFFRLDPTTFAATWSEITTKGPTTMIRRTTEVIEDKTRPAPDELIAAATGPLLQRLRLIPFAERPKYRVSFQGSPASSAFSFEISVAGRETLEIGGRAWDCWRLEFGAGGSLGGLLGGLMGKTRYWYAAAWPHVLVRSTGPASFPGSPLVTLELQTYSSSASNRESTTRPY